MSKFVSPTTNSSTNAANLNSNLLWTQYYGWPCSATNSTWKADNAHQLPHGRLGCPDFVTPVPGGSGFNGPIAEAALPSGTSIYANSIANSIPSELVSHSADLHLTSNNLNYVSCKADMNARATVFLKGIGFNCKTLEDSGGDYATGNFFNNIAVPPNVFAFFIGMNQQAHGYATDYPTSQPLKAGAWYWTWCSPSGQLACEFLRQGGTASQGNVQEPLTPWCGVMPAEALFLLINQGCSMMEANFLGLPADMQGHQIYYFSPFQGWIPWGAPTVYGDPLYSPYANTDFRRTVYWPGVNTPVQFPPSTIIG